MLELKYEIQPLISYELQLKGTHTTIFKLSKSVSATLIVCL